MPYIRDWGWEAEGWGKAKYLPALVLVFVLAACATPTPTADPRIVPTLDAPGWTESVAPISAENVQNLRLLGRLDPPEMQSTAFAQAVSPDGTRLALLTDDEMLAYDLITGALVFRTSRSGASQVYYSPDKTELYTLAPDGIVSIFDAETGGMKRTELLNLPDTPAADAFTGIATYDSGAGTLAAGMANGRVLYWPLSALPGTGEDAPRSPMQSLAEPATPTLMQLLSFSANGQHLAQYGSSPAQEGGFITVWAQGGDGAFSVRTQIAAEMNNRAAYTLALSPDGTYAALGTNTDARLWNIADANTATELREPRTLNSGGQTAIVRFSPTGETLLTGGSEVGFMVWETASGRFIGSLPDTTGITVSAAFSPDGAYLVTSALNQLPGMDAMNGTTTSTTPGAAPNRVTLWSLADSTDTGIGRADLPLNTPVARVDWTADGRLILLFSTNGPVYVIGIGG